MYDNIVQVEQLDDGMIFYLAALPPDSFDMLKQIYYMHTKANWKVRTYHIQEREQQQNHLILRHITSGHWVLVMGRLVCELNDWKISLRELSSECKLIKQLHKVQVAFVKGTNSTSWEAAQKQFPQYTTASQLEPFTKFKLLWARASWAAPALLSTGSGYNPARRGRYQYKG